MASQKRDQDVSEWKTVILTFLRNELAATRKDGFAIGLSGGVDSAVVAALCAEVAPCGALHALYLCDGHNHPRSERYARQVARKLGCFFVRRDIDPLVRARGGYSAGIVRFSRLSPLANRLIVLSARPLYRVLFHDTSFAATLRSDETSLACGLRGALHRGIAAAIEGGFNARHTVRREILEEYAEERNLLPIGAANKTESMVGWFVKGGIDDLVVEPLLDLFKGQVRQLAIALDIPGEVVRQTPSADMFKGVGDELAIGYSYEVLDQALGAIELGQGPDVCERVSKSQFRAIKRLHSLSKWKRENEHRFPRIA